MTERNKKKIDITERSFKFGIEIIKLANQLPKSPAGYRIGGQIIGSGTSIGANINEAQSSDSKKDFVYKMNIALREARETFFWLRIIEASKLISTKFEGEKSENEEIIKILVAIIKNTKFNHINS